MSTADPTNLAELLARVEAIRQASEYGNVANPVIVRDLLAAHDALRALVGRLGEGLRRTQAAMWDSHYGKGITAGYAQTVDQEIRPLIAEAEAVVGKGEK